jgi:hypothetical protein
LQTAGRLTDIPIVIGVIEGTVEKLAEKQVLDFSIKEKRQFNF